MSVATQIAKRFGLTSIRHRSDAKASDLCLIKTIQGSLLSGYGDMSLAWCKTAVSSVLMHWRYCSLALRHWCSDIAYAIDMSFNTLRPRQNGRHFPDDIFKCNFLNENIWISIKISLKFVPGGPINNIPALVQIMAWRRPGDKPLSEPMMV